MERCQCRQHHFWAKGRTTDADADHIFDPCGQHSFSRGDHTFDIFLRHRGVRVTQTGMENSTVFGGIDRHPIEHGISFAGDIRRLSMGDQCIQHIACHGLPGKVEGQVIGAQTEFFSTVFIGKQAGHISPTKHSFAARDLSDFSSGFVSMAGICSNPTR